MQLPLFVLSFLLTSRSLHYVTPGKGGGAWDALKRIDYGGSLSLMIAVGPQLMSMENMLTLDAMTGGLPSRIPFLLLQ
jgi:hypothetical protein